MQAVRFKKHLSHLSLFLFVFGDASHLDLCLTSLWMKQGVKPTSWSPSYNQKTTTVYEAVSRTKTNIPSPMSKKLTLKINISIFLPPLHSIFFQQGLPSPQPFICNHRVPQKIVAYEMKSADSHLASMPSTAGHRSNCPAP